MARFIYSPEESGGEIAAPSGYYQPLETGFIDFAGKRLLYTLGAACIEASCCGVGSWSYLRVQGYAVESDWPVDLSAGAPVVVDTIEGEAEKAAIVEFLRERYPAARIEFR